MPFWNTTAVTNMNSAFKERTKFNANISLWNVSNVISMREMFYSARSFNHDIRVWNVQNLSKVNDIFSGADRMEEAFGVNEIAPIDWFNSLSERNISMLSSVCMKICDLGFCEETDTKDLSSIVGKKFGERIIGKGKLVSTDDSKLSPFLVTAKKKGTLKVQNWIKLSSEASKTTL